MEGVDKGVERDMTPMGEAFMTAYYYFAALQMLKMERGVQELSPGSVIIRAADIAEKARELIQATTGVDAEVARVREEVLAAFVEYVAGSKAEADAVKAALALREET